VRPQARHQAALALPEVAEQLQHAQFGSDQVRWGYPVKDQRAPSPGPIVGRPPQHQLPQLLTCLSGLNNNKNKDKI
jgi:hypothetical protein